MSRAIQRRSVILLRDLPEDSIVCVSAVRGEDSIAPPACFLLSELKLRPSGCDSHALTWAQRAPRTHRIGILEPYRRDGNNDQTDPWISLKSASSDRPLNQAVQRRQNIAFSPLRNCHNFLSIFQMTPLWNGKVLLLDFIHLMLKHVSGLQTATKILSKATIW